MWVEWRDMNGGGCKDTDSVWIDRRDMDGGGCKDTVCGYRGMERGQGNIALRKKTRKDKKKKRSYAAARASLIQFYPLLFSII